MSSSEPERDTTEIVIGNWGNRGNKASDFAPVGRKAKILVIRPDRIGDTVLSTPVLEAIKANYPNHEVHVLVRDVVVPVVEHNPFISKVIVFRPHSLHEGFGGVWRLARILRREKYDVAVTLQV